MPRAIWNGSISFGLVTIPVKLFNAVARKNVRFNQLDDRTGARIKYERVSAADGTEVPPEHIVRGYEYAKGQYVTIDDEELASVTPAAQRTIDIEAFVELDEIDPVFYDGAYYVAPAQGFEKAYKLLVDTLSAENRVAIARFVRSNKQYLAALRPVDGRLLLSTMVWADEVVEPAGIDELAGLEEVKVSDAELAMASQLVESLAAPFDADAYHDTYREELVTLLNRKAAGEDVIAPPAAAADEGRVVDLMAALEASVAAAKAARASREGEGEAATGDGAQVDGAQAAGADDDGTPGSGRARSDGGTAAAPAKRAGGRRPAAAKQAAKKAPAKKAASRSERGRQAAKTTPRRKSA